MSAKMVRLHGVGKRYGTERCALRDVSFDLDKGEFAYVTGVNGSGKTTLLKLLFAMEKPTEGTIVVNNRDVAALPKGRIPLYRREVGYVFQDFKLIPDLTVGENVSLPLDVRQLSKSEIQYRVRGVLALVGLGDRENDPPGSLSGGEQQRIAIARSVVGKPSLLLADEPTGNLDSRTARDIMGLFREIHEMGTTVLIATHDEGLMEEYPSRVIELSQGTILNDRPLD